MLATAAGLEAIGIEPVVVNTATDLRKAKVENDMHAAPGAACDSYADKPVAIRTGTKQAQIIALLQRPEGASIAEIVETTGWMSHSIRGLISGGLKKKLGLPVVTEKQDGRGTVYKLDAA